MYTHGKFPVLEQHFEWYHPSLRVKIDPEGAGDFIAGIDTETGNIQVGSVFEFLSYKVQLFVIYKLISLISRTDSTTQIPEFALDREDATMIRLFRRLPHVAPEFFERLLLSIKARSSETDNGTRQKMLCLLFPGFSRTATHKKQSTF